MHLLAHIWSSADAELPTYLPTYLTTIQTSDFILLLQRKEIQTPQEV